jgi:cysteine desulfurase
MAGIYLDNSASTPVLPEVFEAMRPYFLDQPGNAASSHAFGRRARQALEDARERLAALLDAQPEEVVFTSGATEANNLALFGLVGPAPGTIVTSPIEHPCVLEPVQRLTQQGYRQALLPVTAEGTVDLHQASLPADTCLVSVMLANHETGGVQPIAALAGLLQERAPFHCDAAAAAGKMPLSLRQLGVTSLTISAHKFHGPKGIGALLLRRPARLRPLLWGGHQQQGKRPGTEAVPLAVGMATALAWCVQRLEENRRQVAALRQVFLDVLRSRVAPVVLNGPQEGELPHTLNLSFPGCKADVLLMNLDLAGVACSAGSACSSGSLLPSHVLKAMGLAQEHLTSALRFSFSSLLREDEVTEAAIRISSSVKKLRQVVADDF